MGFSYANVKWNFENSSQLIICILHFSLMPISPIWISVFVVVYMGTDDSNHLENLEQNSGGTNLFASIGITQFVYRLKIANDGK